MKARDSFCKHVFKKRSEVINLTRRRERENIMKWKRVYPTLNLDFKDYLVCYIKVVTSEIPTLSDLILNSIF